jgi:hypothetical protein
MDHIDETLTSQSIDPKFEPSIRAALGLAKKTLNCYYSATDHKDVYRIAMGMSLLIKVSNCFFSSIYCDIVLHPRHKLQYFEMAGWEQEWIDTAEEIVRKDFEQSCGTSPVIHKQSETLQAPRKPQKVCVQFYLIIDTWINKI